MNPVLKHIFKLSNFRIDLVKKFDTFLNQAINDSPNKHLSNKELSNLIDKYTSLLKTQYSNSTLQSSLDIKEEEIKKIIVEAEEVTRKRFSLS